MFKTTQQATARYILLESIKRVREKFRIDWPSVTWQELRKPLYSGLGQKLYMEYSTRSVAAKPRGIEDQARYWKKYYRTDGKVKDFVESSKALEESK